MITCCRKISDLQGIQPGQENHEDPDGKREKDDKGNRDDFLNYF